MEHIHKLTQTHKHTHTLFNPIFTRDPFRGSGVKAAHPGGPGFLHHALTLTVTDKEQVEVIQWLSLLKMFFRQ